jgi:hypothetical protein
MGVIVWGASPLYETGGSVTPIYSLLIMPSAIPGVRLSTGGTVWELRRGDTLGYPIGPFFGSTTDA